MEETAAPTPPVELKGEKLNISISFKKQNFPVEIGSENTLSELRQYVARLTGVAPGLQKLMLKGNQEITLGGVLKIYYAGMLKDDAKTLKELNLKDGVKIMLIGSTISDVMQTAAVPQPTPAEAAEGNNNHFGYYNYNRIILRLCIGCIIAMSIHPICFSYSLWSS